VESAPDRVNPDLQAICLATGRCDVARFELTNERNETSETIRGPGLAQGITMTQPRKFLMAQAITVKQRWEFLMAQAISTKEGGG